MDLARDAQHGAEQKAAKISSFEAKISSFEAKRGNAFLRLAAVQALKAQVAAEGLAVVFFVLVLVKCSVPVCG